VGVATSDPIVVAQRQFAPVFTRHPHGRVVNVGEAAALSVTVIAVPPATLQWFKDGQPVAGATSETLRIPEIGMADAGRYYCAATNKAGAAPSRLAALTIGGERARRRLVIVTQHLQLCVRQSAHACVRACVCMCLCVCVCAYVPGWML
jgi:hypothetical protein